MWRRNILRASFTALLFTPLLAAQAPAHPAVVPMAPVDANPASNAGRKQLTEYLDGIAATDTANRRKVTAAITTRKQAEARQVEVRKKILALIGGLPAKTPLNAHVLGTTLASMGDNGFHIEKIIFDSQPDFPVTALLYLPNSKPNLRSGTKSQKLPAIVMAPGHGPLGKASDYAYAAAFAQNGFAVLDYDPIGQGERLQYPDPAKPGPSLLKRPTGEQDESGLQATLIGDAVARYFAWDSIRAVDYLQSRSEIDPNRIGAFGCSGGGTMTALLTALDPRIKATGVACYITSYDTLLPSIGPQGSEQSIPGFIAAGLDFPDWVEVAAPHPFAIIATTADMFPFVGAQQTEAEARRFYQLFGANQNLEFLTGPGGHGNLAPILPRILSFFIRSLQPGSNAAHPILLTPPPLPKEAFQDTSTGQVATSYPVVETVHSLNLKRLNSRPQRKVLLGEALRAAVRNVTKSSATPSTPAEPPKFTAFEADLASNSPNIVLQSVTLYPEQGIELHGEFAGQPFQNAHPAILLLTDAVSEPPNSVAHQALTAYIQSLAASGNVVLAISPRPSPPGTEETKSPVLGVFYLSELRAELVGKTLIGMRIDDIIHALDYLCSRTGVDSKRITAQASGHLGLVLLQAAVLDPRLTHVMIDHALSSYRSLVEAPMPAGAPEDILPGVLLQYDLPDLVSALGSRVTIVHPLNGTDDLSAPPNSH